MEANLSFAILPLQTQTHALPDLVLPAVLSECSAAAFSVAGIPFVSLLHRSYPLWYWCIAALDSTIVTAPEISDATLLAVAEWLGMLACRITPQPRPPETYVGSYQLPMDEPGILFSLSSPLLES